MKNCVFLFALVASILFSHSSEARNHHYRHSGSRRIDSLIPPHTIKMDSTNLLTDARQWVAAYYRDRYEDDSIYSLVMNTKYLLAYMDSNSDVSALHIYLCYNDSANYRFDLAIIGAAQPNPKRKYTHINFLKDDKPMVFSNFYDAKKMNVRFDDKIDTGITPPTLPFEKPTADTSLIQKSHAQFNITTYQEYYYVRSNLSYSFLIDARALKSFLTEAAHQSVALPDNIVPYLQVYLAYKKGILTLIFVGVDNDGTHVYYRRDNDNQNYILDQCRPCPECFVNYDTEMDGPVNQFVPENGGIRH